MHGGGGDDGDGDTVAPSGATWLHDCYWQPSLLACARS